MKINLLWVQLVMEVFLNLSGLSLPVILFKHVEGTKVCPQCLWGPGLFMWSWLKGGELPHSFEIFPLLQDILPNVPQVHSTALPQIITGVE